ncbi:hypothetical protein [Neochlamydia sp. S13]|uniref:hypothetical protein n=1 Tax=Neochlamydia sp. S13 TaxID=1353976 RepID=UPI0005A8D675|nr:hypothetical protein [Neochlamydia sp. S13]BBI16687.1 hypothetical protein NCS13_1_0492 [Neochlamydia sp. S13]
MDEKAPTSGTTVSFALIFDNPYTQNEEVWIGNLGNSWAILGIDPDCQQLTTDARYRNEKGDLNVGNKQFLTSIHLREGWVDKDEQNIHRLAGILQPLRGIGHQDIKGFFSCPAIQRINLSPFKEPVVLVLATDATMEVLGSQEIIPLLQNEEELADKLVKEAIKC